MTVGCSNLSWSPQRHPRSPLPAVRGGLRPRENTEGTDLSEPLPEFDFNQRLSW